MTRRAAQAWIAFGGFMAGVALAATIGYRIAGVDNWYVTIMGVVMGISIIGMHWNEGDEE